MRVWTGTRRAVHILTIDGDDAGECGSLVRGHAADRSIAQRDALDPLCEFMPEQLKEPRDEDDRRRDLNRPVFDLVENSMGVLTLTQRSAPSPVRCQDCGSD